MKILFLTLIALLILFLAAIGGWYFLSKNPGEPTQPTSNTPIFPGSTRPVSTSPATSEETASLESEFNTEVQDSTNLQLSNIVISTGYAMAVYSDENVGGMAVFKRESAGVWTLLGTDGGVFNMDALLALGIPESVASALLDASI